jgi:DNA-binding XRE family transcriptional regulator
MERDFRLSWPDLVKEAVKRRKELRMTQDYVALFTGVSKPTIIAFEQGKETVTVKNALKILKALGLAS